MIAHPIEEHLTSMVTSCNIRRAAGSGVALQSGTRHTVPLQWNMWYHATHINRGTAFSVGATLRLYHSTDWVLSVEWSWVELSWEFGSWKPSQVLQWDRWQPARTWGHEHGSWGICGVGSCYQATSKDTADWEDLVHAVVNCRVCELAIALQFLVVNRLLSVQ
jgi:hypothetical protein